jgi:hypothetical protein
MCRILQRITDGFGLMMMVQMVCVYPETGVFLCVCRCLTRCEPHRSSAFQETQIMAATCFIR